MANEYSADIPKGFNVPKQVRLDSITGIQNENALKNLGPGNNLAFKYYEGLKVYCKDEKTEYIWREVVGVETGLLNTHFTYPTYTAVDGINYSGKSFNFFELNNATLVVDGSETKINSGTNTTINGLGTIASPYVINSTDTVANGSETKINEGDNIIITGVGTTLNPYIINADLTDFGIEKTDDAEIIAPGQTLSIINNEPTGKVLATREYVDSVVPNSADGSETKLTEGTNITITGVGTISDPYIINTENNLSATKIEYNNSLTDGDFLFVGDVLQYTDENAQEAVGNIIVDTDTINFVYDNGIPNISADIKPDSINALHLSDTIKVSEFINDVDYATNSALDVVQSDVDNLRSQVNPSTYIVTNTGTNVIGNTFTLNSNWSWVINGIDYTNLSTVNITLPLAASGYTRVDLIVLNSSNVAIRVPGIETTGIAISPTIPLNTIIVSYIFSNSTSHNQVLPNPTYPTSVSLQQSYNNSVVPEITTTNTLGAVTIKRGSVSDTDNVFIVKNGSNMNKVTIKGNGFIICEDVNTQNIMTNYAFINTRLQLTDSSVIAYSGSSTNIIKTTATGWESGIKIDYQSDLSGTYTARSLTDKTYVDKNRLSQYTVGTLPAGTEGDSAYVTDATAPTYLGALTGGGAIKCPVFYNGSSWVSH